MRSNYGINQMMSKEIQHLIIKYLTRQATLPELDELSKWIEDESNKREFIKYIKVNHAVDFNMKKFSTDNSKKQLLQFIEKEKKIHRIKQTLNVMKYAAILVVFLGVGYFFKNGFFENKPDSIDVEPPEPVVLKNEIKTGTDRAILTLEDGTNIDLEKGKTIRTKNVESNGEELVYNSSTATHTEIAYNYLTIPRGGQFHIKLADGTLVWLNSESQLKYPVAFIEGETRNVELVYGEAYFEVAPSTEHKGAMFKVLNASQEIEVLGTKFNIKAYKDETNIYTTLVEGKVKINTAKSEQILEPNQQSDLNLKNNRIRINPVNVANEISWRRGLFSFKGKSLDEISRVLSRWYDVDFVFEKTELKDIKFNGVLSKQEPIEEILNSILTTNYVKAYEIKNKKITLK